MPDSAAFDGQTFLVTGGTGSFGHAVVNRLLKTAVREIRVFSRDEKKQEDMRLRLADSRIKYFIGDVREYRSVLDAMHGVNYVFHAAALKQVPSCEFHPMEAVRTNILGAENVVTAAIEAKVVRLVALSTDKAVYPINAMGLSKAMMEKMVIAKSRSAGSTILCATRYGNVMASRGSVIPLFLRQITEGRRMTVTDPAMTRFMMSLEDSVDLVLFALREGGQGDILVQKAPACTVAVLAEALRELFQSEVPIEIIGTRHGEKLFESLVSREEMVRAEDLDEFYRIAPDARDLAYDKYVSAGEESISQAEDYTSHNTRRLEKDEVKELLLSLSYIQGALRGERARDEG